MAWFRAPGATTVFCVAADLDPKPADAPDDAEGGTDALQGAELARRGFPWGRIGVAVAIISTVGLWAYAFLWPQPLFGKLDDATFPTAAEGVCAPIRASVDALPKPFETPINTDRAAVIVQANDQIATMLDRLATLPRGNEKAKRSIDEWLADYHDYLTNRREYAERLKTDPGTRLYVSQSTRDNRDIGQAIDRFANVNAMSSCATFVDVA